MIGGTRRDLETEADTTILPSTERWTESGMREPTMNIGLG
jgi:hypothetical protein